MPLHVRKTEISDPIWIRDWILSQLAVLGVPLTKSQAMVAGIQATDGGHFYDPKVMMAYWEDNGGVQGSSFPDNTQLSLANHYLLAPACYAHGERVWHWYIPSDKSKKYDKPRPIDTKDYIESYLVELRQVAKRVGRRSPEDFFRAWVSRPEFGRKLKVKVGKPPPQNEIRYSDLNRKCSSILGDLACQVTDQTKVLLVMHASGPVHDHHLVACAEATGGEICAMTSRSCSIVFEAKAELVMPAIRAMRAAHRLLTHLTSGANETSGLAPLGRVLIEQAPVTAKEAEARQSLARKLLAAKTLGPYVGEVYLDSYLWGVIGHWADAERQVPGPVPGLSTLGQAWARLDSLSDSRLVFGESTIKRGTLVCRGTQQRAIGQAWDEVLTKSVRGKSSRATIICVEGEDGSGKRSLVDDFSRKRVSDHGATAVPLRFVNAGPSYPFRPYIEQIMRLFDIDPGAPISDQQEKLTKRLNGLKGVNRRHITALLSVHGRTYTESVISASDSHRKGIGVVRALMTVIQAAIIREATKNPLAIVATDVHRASEESKRLFWTICEAICTHPEIMKLPILLVYTTRFEPHDETKGKTETFIKEDIHLGPLTDKEFGILRRQYEADGFRIPDELVKSFRSEGAVFPGRFVSQLILPKGGNTPEQRGNAMLARLLKPHGESLEADYTSVDTLTVGLLVLMSILGSSTYPSTLGKFLISLSGLMPTHAEGSDLEGEFREKLFRWLDDILDRAVTAGILDCTSGEAEHGRQFSFVEPLEADALQRRLRSRLSRSPKSRVFAGHLARTLSSVHVDAEAKQWAAAGAIVSFSAYRGEYCRYWQAAGEENVRLGHTNAARRQFYTAYRLALREARISTHDELAWTRVLEAYRRYIYALRLLNVTPRPEVRQNYEDYARKSNVYRQTTSVHFNTRLCLWHFMDMEGRHNDAAEWIKWLRRALEKQTDERVSEQQHRELVYAAWATAMARGQLSAATRYYGQLMTLGVLSRENNRAEITLSSGHDLELYAPARHAAVHWLTGDFSGVHEFRRLIQSRLRGLQEEDRYRRFWAAAYFIPLAMFLRWEDTVHLLMPYVRSKACADMGETMAHLAVLIERIANVHELSSANELNALLSPIVHDQLGPGGQKHRSVWVCLVARRWLDLKPPADLHVLAGLLDETRRFCETKGELFLLPDLLRLRALVHHRLGEHDRCQELLSESIERARGQGAVTLEIESIRESLSLYSKQNMGLCVRLDCLFEQCDFPIQHPVAQQIRKALKVESEFEA